MKTKISLSLLLLFGFSAVANANASIPTPIFYKLSKRLLSETQHFVDGGDVKTVKVKPVKVNGNSATLKCEAQKEQDFKKIGSFIWGAPQGLWKTDSNN